ncbi:MAG: redoxin domain-containing protein [Alistipes sp.]|nr:redoxin domain-containing protein [Alistipes sp.]
MKRFLLAAMASVALLASCSNNGANTTVEGRFVSDRVDSVYLERISDSYDAVERIDGVALGSDGGFKFEFDVDDETSPRLYRLSFNTNVRPITLVVAAEDNIYLDSAGDLFLNYEVKNSEESQLIKQFNREYYSAVDRLARLSQRIATTEGDMLELNKEAYKAAMEAIQCQVRFVGSNPNTLAAFYASRQHVAEEYVPMLEGKGISTPHIHMLKEGLSESYPDSPYIALLQSEIESAEAFANLADKIVESPYPDIELDDMYKNMHSLSELSGKVVLLYFWTAELPLCNNINAELKTLYEKYHDEGFEVYHVSADANRALWIEATRAQQLPWISVFGSTDPRVFSLYSVVELPMAYIISKSGDIELCPLAIDGLEREIKKRL